MDKNDSKTLAYKIGYIFASVIIACLTISIIALTVKFLFWLF